MGCWVIVAIVLGALMLLGIFAGATADMDRQFAGTGSQSREVIRLSRDLEPRDGPDQRVTMNEFNRITDGMTYSQVVAIIGFPGEEQSSSSVAGIRTVMYGWQNPDGGNMTAMFQDGGMVMKAQFGLP